MWVVDDSSVLIKKSPNCKILIDMINNENTGKPNYGTDMRSCFSPDTFNVKPNYQKWTSAVGNFLTTLSGNDRPYLSSDRKNFKGARMEQSFVKGSYHSKVNFGNIRGAGTFCSKTRYTGAKKGRILTGGEQNWLHGHHNGRAGVAHYHTGWVGSYDDVTPINDWVVLCCSNAGVNRYVNGVKKNDNAVKTGGTDTIWINGGAFGGEVSDWGAAFMVSWNRDLSHDELIKVSNYLLDGSTEPETSFQITVKTNTVSVPALTADKPTFFSWSLSVTGLVEKKCTDFSSTCKTTSYFHNSDTCKDNDLQVLVPRSKDHFISLKARFGASYFNHGVTGIYCPKAGSYTSVKFNSDDMPETGYKALDGGKFWLRDKSYSEPNGNYNAGGWLYFWKGKIGDINNIEFDDNQAQPASKYVCSDNNERRTELFLNPPSGIISIPSDKQLMIGAEVVGTSSLERIAESIAPSTLRYVLTVKACNIVAPSLYDPSYASGMLTSSGSYKNAAIGISYSRGRLGDTGRAWSALKVDQNQWWQIQSATSMIVAGVAVKGRPDTDQWVTKWKFQYWDGAAWKWVDGGNTFNGNADRNTQIEIAFNNPVATFKVRFRPWAWSGYPSARMALKLGHCSPGYEADLSICRAPENFVDYLGRCRACSEGKMSLANDATGCQDLCLPGTYLLNGACVDMTTKTCIGGQGFFSASSKPLDSKFPLHGSTANDGTCTPCSSGYFKTETAAVICTSCIAGMFATSGASTCTDCFTGQYNDVATGGVSACKVCPAGTFREDPKATALAQCEGCYAGQYSSASAAACIECPAGTKLKDKTGDPPLHDNVDDCTDCEVNSYNPFPGLGAECFPCLSAKTARATECGGCNPGKYTTTNACADCVIGFYSSDRDASECAQCPIGYYGYDDQNAQAFTTCISCARGKYGDSVQASVESSCKHCAAGRFSEDFHLKKEGSEDPCKKCPKGRWSDAEGIEKESLCQNCLPGKYGSANGGAAVESSCVQCVEGKFSEVVGAWQSSTCRDCPSGFYIADLGLTYCLPCQVRCDIFFFFKKFFFYLFFLNPPPPPFCPLIFFFF